MTSFGSIIDDPEKHFLGDLLLDDDPAQPASLNRDSVSEIPSAAVISGTGPSGNSFWPEPPPPYSASVNMPSWSPPSHNINHVLHRPLKEPSQWDSILQLPGSIFGVYPPSQQQPFAPVHIQPRHAVKPIILPSPQTNTRFVDDHRREIDPPEPDCPISNKQRLSQLNSVRSSSSSTSVKSTRSSRSADNQAVRGQQLTPPPPEPIHKLPFSYRDVAGRGTILATGHRLATQRNSAPVSANNTQQQQQKQRLGSASSAVTDCALNREFQRADERRKSKRRSITVTANTENEFQKVPRKKGQVAKIERVVNVTPVFPDSSVVGAPPVVLDAVSRWNVLSTLSPLKDKNHQDTEANKIRSSDTNIAVRKDSRTSSIGDGDAEGDRLLPRRGQKKIVKTIVEPVKKLKIAKKKSTNEFFEKFALLFTFVFTYIDSGLKWLFNLLFDVILMIYGLVTHVFQTSCLAVCVLIRNVYMGCLNHFVALGTRVRRVEWFRFWKTQEVTEYSRWGLDQNIQLPTTGDEAIARLLRCRGQDAYVILGLRADAHDDEINQYYKRQSQLIHPDKNPSECAEEAFLVIQKAYEMIGYPEERKNYNLANINKNPMHAELEELWERLRIKVDEVRSTMHCDCGERHTRIHIETMKASEGRFCGRCNCRHPAKQNDIWAESRLFGFVWVYYTCVEGQIYDISHWANCESNQLKHLRPDAHSVQYRLVSSAPPPPPLGKFGSPPPSIREEVRSSPDMQQLTYHPPDRNSDDRPRKANNRRHRKVR